MSSVCQAERQGLIDAGRTLNHGARVQLLGLEGAPEQAEGADERFSGQRMVICLLPRVSVDSSDTEVSFSRGLQDLCERNGKVLDFQNTRAGS